MSYGHFTAHDRTVIFYLRMAGLNNAEIARKLGRHRANIGRELGRNVSPGGQYLPDVAQLRANGARTRTPTACCANTCRSRNRFTS